MTRTYFYRGLPAVILALVALISTLPEYARADYPLTSPAKVAWPLKAPEAKSSWPLKDCDCDPCTCGENCKCLGCKTHHASNASPLDLLTTANAVGCGRKGGNAGAANGAGDELAMTYYVGQATQPVNSIPSFPFPTQTVSSPAKVTTAFAEGCTCPCCGMKMTKEQCDKMNLVMSALEASKTAQLANPVVAYSAPVTYSTPMTYASPTVYYSTYGDASGASACAGGNCGAGSQGLFGGRFRSFIRGR